MIPTDVGYADVIPGKRAGIAIQRLFFKSLLCHLIDY